MLLLTLSYGLENITFKMKDVLKNQYSRREEIMKGLEKLKAVDVEKGKNKE
jgi:hypothetical protein